MTRPAVLLAAVLFLPLLLSACASAGPPSRSPAGQREFHVPSVDEELFGTWAIAEPAPAGAAARLRIYSWGLVEGFAGTVGAAPDWRSTSIIDQSWTDERGFTWYREYRRGAGGELWSGNAFVLDKVSADGQVLESIFGKDGWPETAEMDPGQNPTYVRYLRRQ